MLYRGGASGMLQPRTRLAARRRPPVPPDGVSLHGGTPEAI